MPTHIYLSVHMNNNLIETKQKFTVFVLIVNIQKLIYFIYLMTKVTKPSLFDVNDINR